MTAVDHDRTPLDQATRAAARLSRVVETALDQVGLSLPQYRLMVLLGDGSSVATALARRLTVSRPSITALADGLVDRGYVERLPDPDDRRRVTHTLTPAGHTALAAGDEAISARLDTVVAHLSPRQRRTAVDGLALWLQALDLHRATQEATPA